MAARLTFPSSVHWKTRRSANSGMKRETGSSRRNLPASTSISTPTLVIGLVIEAIRKIVSGVIGRPASMSRRLTQASWATSSCRATSMTAPAISPCSTHDST